MLSLHQIKLSAVDVGPTQALYSRPAYYDRGPHEQVSRWSAPQVLHYQMFGGRSTMPNRLRQGAFQTCPHRRTFGLAFSVLAFNRTHHSGTQRLTSEVEAARNLVLGRTLAKTLNRRAKLAYVVTLEVGLLSSRVNLLLLLKGVSVVLNGNLGR